MGKGKGRFDYWAARVAVSKVIFEIEGGVHEKVAREAVRLAGNKLPGMIVQLEIRPPLNLSRCSVKCHRDHC